MSWSDLEGARALSAACFGQRYKLELMVAIAEDQEGVVNLKDLAAVIGVSSGTLQKSVKELAAIGILDVLPRGDSRKVHYRRLDSAGWGFAIELASDFRSASPTAAGISGQPGRS